MGAPVSCSSVPLSLVVGAAFAMLSDVICSSALRFLVDVFSFVVDAEFKFGVLALEEFRWKIFPCEDLQPLVVLGVLCHLHGKLLVIHRS